MTEELGGQVVGTTTWNDRRIGTEGVSTPLVFKYDNAGHLIWLDELTGLNGYVSSVGTSAIGTVVAAGIFSGNRMVGSDQLSYTPQNQDSAAMLLVLEADGSARWARQFDGGQRWTGPQIAVDPPGHVAIAFRMPSCNGTTIEKFNLAGAHLWTRTFKPEGCQGSVDAAGITLSNHNVVVSGAMSGIVDFGRGPLPQAAGFLLELSP